MAKLLGLNINKIKLLAIGFNAEIDGIDYTSSVKEFLLSLFDNLFVKPFSLLSFSSKRSFAC